MARSEARNKFARLAAKWVINDVRRVLNKRKIPITDFPIEPERLAKLVFMVHTGQLLREIEEQKGKGNLCEAGRLLDDFFDCDED